MSTTEALLACLPPESYDRRAPLIVQEAVAAAAPLDVVIDYAGLLRIEHQPDLTTLALPDWERNYGLPDACMGGGDAPEAIRRANLLQRIAAKGDLSRAHMLAIAASVGYPGSSIFEYEPMSCEDSCEDALFGENWIGVWRLDVLTSTAIYEMSCEDTCETALRSWGNEQLECVINRRKPAGSIALFGYPA